MSTFYSSAEGADDNLWSNAVCPVLNLLYTLIHPIYVVVQCGSDCLATDPHQTFNLTNRYPAVDDPTDEDSEIEICMSGYLRALKQILSWQVPTLILGGGGYNFPDTARLWTKLTALAIEHKEGSLADVKQLEVPITAVSNRSHTQNGRTSEVRRYS
ncbi:unnamed protein product [Calicophoron daubneyi]|uniref:Histone deacetylase domain-containing protein n=1 Tax=Calicophoron daubneyi TaxID=300641 RepID=A0AAV2TDJ7_CALDB